MDSEYIDIKDVFPAAEWQLWFQDNFDRECPRSIDLRGTGLGLGLVELWLRHLFETVQLDGTFGFSRFNLWWVQRKVSIFIIGNLQGQALLRDWVFGDQRSKLNDYRRIADLALLENIALAHGRLIQNGLSSEPLIEMAKNAPGKTHFINQLLNS